MDAALISSIFSMATDKKKDGMKLILSVESEQFLAKMTNHILNLVDGIKINHILYDQIETIRRQLRSDQELFVDFKLFDTPNTVESVAKDVISKGGTMLTVSTFNNEEAFKRLSNLDIKLLGVTFLTSWSPQEQADITRQPIPIRKPLQFYEMWKSHLSRVMENNFYGMVCAVDDIHWVKSPIQGLKTICPGIKVFENDENTGQVRTSSPTQAKKEGADYIVIGRSVTNSDRPLTVLELINNDIRD